MLFLVRNINAIGYLAACFRLVSKARGKRTVGRFLPSPETYFFFPSCGASQVALVVKSPPSDVGDIRDSGSIPGLGRPLGGGYGNPPAQYSCLEDLMDRGVWWATGHSVVQSRT